MGIGMKTLGEIWVEFAAARAAARVARQGDDYDAGRCCAFADQMLHMYLKRFNHPEKEELEDDTT